MLENALQAEKQDVEQRSKQRRWRPGQSGNPRGRESKASRLARREATIARWAEPYGGVAELKPAELDLLHQAAELSLMRPRTVEDQVRVANTISKILAQVGFADKRRKREPPSAPDLATYLRTLKSEAPSATASPVATASPERETEPAESDGVTDEAVHTPNRRLERARVPDVARMDADIEIVPDDDE